MTPKSASLISKWKRGPDTQAELTSNALRCAPRPRLPKCYSLVMVSFDLGPSFSNSGLALLRPPGQPIRNLLRCHAIDLRKPSDCPAVNKRVVAWINDNDCRQSRETIDDSPARRNVEIFVAVTDIHPGHDIMRIHKSPDFRQRQERSQGVTLVTPVCPEHDERKLVLLLRSGQNGIRRLA